MRLSGFFIRSIVLPSFEILCRKFLGKLRNAFYVCDFAARCRRNAGVNYIQHSNTLDSNSTSPQLAPGRLNTAGHLVLMVLPADIFFSLLKEMLDAAAARQKYY